MQAISTHTCQTSNEKYASIASNCWLQLESNLQSDLLCIRRVPRTTHTHTNTRAPRTYKRASERDRTMNKKKNKRQETQSKNKTTITKEKKKRRNEKARTYLLLKRETSIYS